jgi:hypothetical protein
VTLRPGGLVWFNWYMTETPAPSSGSIARHIVKTVNRARRIGSERPLLDGADGGTALGALVTESASFRNQVDSLVARGDLKVTRRSSWRQYWLQIQALAETD